MKTEANNTVSNSNITIFRYKIEELEKRLLQEHEVIKSEIAIPLGKDLGAMQPSKPEMTCEKDVYTGVISGPYSKMMMTAKKELQAEIETHHIVSDKIEADKKLAEHSKELEKKETEYRLKKRELDKSNNSLIKKAQRYKLTRFVLVFLILVDTLISGTALQGMGYPLITSYVIGLAIGIGIFLLAENLPEIIQKGSTAMGKILIAITAFIFLFGVFYILGIFRSTTFNSSTDFGTGIKPIYFACLNMFFSIIATLVVYFKGLSKEEKKILDEYRLTKELVDKLEAEIKVLKEAIVSIRQEQASSELARKQILIYGNNIEELIQSLYEESQKTFYSTNCIHRSDGKVPKFFEYDIPRLPSYKTSIKL
ncbi:MAG: hypothetical protein PSN34_11760 [Urechidicola sp.]|nr:hypothetical protein [Urechidicola sp.]